MEIVALCDKVPAHVERAQRTLSVHGLPAAQEFTGADDWRRVCELEGVDLIYNCTDWQMHVPIALYAMERGKHVAVEVPAALTVADCWALVDAAERTRRHCMMLENCCYDFFEMTTLNMAREGLFGEIVHVEGAYIHDLRELQFDRRHGYVDMWRLEHNALHTGNPYPTHGLGPLCQLLDIHRGDRMERLWSRLPSDQFGMRPRHGEVRRGVGGGREALCVGRHEYDADPHGREGPAAILHRARRLHAPRPVQPAPCTS